MGALDGKVAIVTGGTGGIGEKIVEAFVAQGASVVMAARREDDGLALEKRLGVRFVRADVAVERDVKAMVDRTVEWFGRVDCLVNNAGIPSPMVSITEIEVATIDQVLAVNVRGVVLGGKHVAPIMISKGRAASSTSAAWRVFAEAFQPIFTAPRKARCRRSRARSPPSSAKRASA